MPTKTKTPALPTGDALTAFVVHVRENDLLLKARPLHEAPEGAGSWRYLIADLLGVRDEDGKIPNGAVTPAMVATVKAADAAAREAAKDAKAAAPAKKAPAKKAPAKKAPATVAKAAAPAPDALADVMAKIDALTEVVGTMASVVFDVEA